MAINRLWCTAFWLSRTSCTIISMNYDGSFFIHNFFVCLHHHITYVDYLLYSSRLLINAVMSWWCLNANSFLTYTTRASRLINVNKSGIMAVEAAQKVCLPRLWYICMPCMHANIVFYRLNKPTSSCLQYIMRACMIALSLSSQHSIFCQFRVVLFLYNLIAWPSDCVLPIIWIPCSRYRCFDFGYVICVRSLTEIARDHFREQGTHEVIAGVVSPVHDKYNKNGLVSAKHRSAMVKLSLQTSDWIRLSDWECMKQNQWTRTRVSLQYHQNYINSILNDTNGTVNEIIPGWVPENIKKYKGERVQIKLLCGADLLESFAVKNLWEPEDVS